MKYRYITNWGWREFVEARNEADEKLREGQVSSKVAGYMKDLAYKKYLEVQKRFNDDPESFVDVGEVYIDGSMMTFI